MKIRLSSVNWTTLGKKIKEQEEETERLWVEQDELEQYSRKSSLEIHGLPENVYSSTEEAVLEIAKALNVEMTPNDKGGAGMAQWGEHSPPTNVARVRFPDPASYVG